MTDIDLTPRVRGRAPKASARVALVGPLTEADLGALSAPRESKAPTVARLKDSHHRLARCLASGMTHSAAAAQTGYSINSVWRLNQDPSFIDLIAVYRRASAETFAEYSDVAMGNLIKGERLIEEALEAAGERDEPLSLGELRPVADLVSDRADRFGYPRQNVSHNVNHDLASRLEAARRRSGLVDVTPNAPPTPPDGEPVT